MPKKNQVADKAVNIDRFEINIEGFENITSQMVIGLDLDNFCKIEDTVILNIDSANKKVVRYLEDWFDLPRQSNDYKKNIYIKCLDVNKNAVILCELIGTWIKKRSEKKGSLEIELSIDHLIYFRRVS